MTIPLITPLFAEIMKFLLKNITENFGIAIILFTFITKLITFPLQYKSKKGFIKQAKLLPRQQELQKKYKNEKERYQQELQKLYKEEGVSMFGMGGCLPMLLVMLVLIGLYGCVARPLGVLMGVGDSNAIFGPPYQWSFLDYINQIGAGLATTNKNEIVIAAKIKEVAGNIGFDQLKDLYPGIFAINFNFLGLNLAEQPSLKFNALLILPILSGATSFALSLLTSRLTPPTQPAVDPDNPKPAFNGKIMQYMTPLMSLWFGFMLPAGLTLYWTIGNIMSLAQEPLLVWLARRNTPTDDIKPSKGGKKKIYVDADDDQLTL